jgi:hypothetical protein
MRLLVGAFAVFIASSLATSPDARDAKRGERIVGDDDPLILPAFIDPSIGTEVRPRGYFDPETTGSTEAPKQRRACARVAWFVNRAPEDQFKPAC